MIVHYNERINELCTTSNGVKGFQWNNFYFSSTINDKVLKCGFDSIIYLGFSSVDMYANVGS